MKDFEIEAAQKVESLITGCHFTRAVVDRLTHLLKCAEIVPRFTYTPEFLAALRYNLHLSDGTWRKVIMSDPMGWRESLEGRWRELS